MLLWHRLDPAQIERAVKLLIRRLHPSAQGIDGAGGDGGQDIRWESPEGLVIFEVKSHTERLTTAQKRNIYKSLARAVTHQPVQWRLILPLDPSPSELAWLKRLCEEFSGVAIDWLGRDWLDAQFAEHTDLRRFVEGVDSELLARAHEHGLEQAVLANGVHDLAARHGRLARLAEDMSPFWRVDVHSTAGGITNVFREKYPGAALDDPISFTPHLTFPVDDPEAQRVRLAFQRSMDFGAPAHIPTRFVERIDVGASATTRQLFDLDKPMGDLHFEPVEDRTGLPTLGRLERFDDSGRHLYGVDMMMTRRRRGIRGGSLFGTDAGGALKLEVRFAVGVDIDEADNSFQLTLEPITGKMPHAIVPALRLLAEGRDGDQLSFSVGGAMLGVAPIPPDSIDPDLVGVLKLTAAIGDLQRHNGIAFAIPDDLDDGEIRDLINLATVLRGEKVRMRWNNLTAKVQPGKLPDVLRTVQDRGALFIKHEQFGQEIDGHELSIGPVQLYAPRIRLHDRAGLEAIGVNAEEERIRFIPFGGEGIYLMPGTDTGDFNEAAWTRAARD